MRRVNHEKAMEILASRVDIHGQPLFDYDSQKWENRSWCDKIVAQPYTASEELVEWECGGLEL